ncbi:MAG: DUF3667 domain-containing protein [Janthinobacterium lividum]
MSSEQHSAIAEQAPPKPQTGTRSKKPPAPKPEHCLNCGAAATGKFCAECGQENEDQTIAMKLLVQDLLSDLASFDSKLFRTLVPLIIRPGFLTNEYNLGRRVRYLSPFKLYLTFSILFFLVVPLTHTDSLVKINPSDASNAGIAIKTAQQNADARIKADADLKDAQADLKDDLHDDAPGLKTPAIIDHSRLLAGGRSYDLTHLPATVEVYDAQQRDPRHPANPNIVQYFKRQVIKVKQNPHLLSAALLNYIPKMMFVLLPAFALSLKLVYVRSKRLYVEHLIFGLHLHAFLFLLLTLLIAAQAFLPHASFIDLVVTISALLYPYFALRTVYKQGWGKTFVKYTLLALNYIILLAFTFSAALTVAFLVL